MPRYTVEHIKSGKQRTKEMKMDELQPWLADHPNYIQVFVVNIADPVSIGVLKPPADFQRLLGRMKEKIPESHAIASRRWDIPKEI